MVTERVEHDDLAVNHHAVELEGLVEPASGPLEPRRQDDRQTLDGQPLALVRQLDERGARSSRILIHDAVDEQVARVEPEDDVQQCVLRAWIEHQKQDALGGAFDPLRRVRQVDALQDGSVPCRDAGAAERVARGRGAVLGEARRIARPGVLELFPASAIRRGEFRALDENAVVDLRAEPGRRPVRAPGPKGRGLAARVTKHDELVVGEVRAPHQPVVHVDAAVPPEILAHVGIFVRHDGRALLLVRRLVGTGTEQQVAPPSDRFQRIEELRVVQLIERRIDLDAIGLGLGQEGQQRLAKLAAQDDAIPRGRVVDISLKRFLRRPLPRQPLRRDDAAVEVGLELVRLPGADPHPRGPPAPLRSRRHGEVSGGPDHRGRAIADLLPRLHAIVRPDVTLDRPLGARPAFTLLVRLAFEAHPGRDEGDPGVAFDLPR